MRVFEGELRRELELAPAPGREAVKKSACAARRSCLCGALCGALCGTLCGIPGQLLACALGLVPAPVLVPVPRWVALVQISIFAGPRGLECGNVEVRWWATLEEKQPLAQAVTLIQ